MNQSNHKEYMTRALALAERGRYSVTPNPMVGCVIVKHGEIIGEGYHHHAGGDHAEVIALKQAGNAAKDATAYVTLEPCCHYGKTPPCTLALIKAGIKKVYIASLDPNPIVSGNGVAELTKANIEIEIGLLRKEAETLNAIFFHYMTCRRPYIIAKWAMSLDGKTVTHPHDDRKISSTESHRHVHQTRQMVDAILIGKNTAILDNPLLTVRSDTNINRQPLRIVVSSYGDLPHHLNLISDTDIAKTMVVTTKLADQQNLNYLKEHNIDVLTVNKTSDNRVDLQHMLDLLGRQGITSLLIEGGKTIHESFFQLNLVNKVDVYLAPVVIANLSKKLPMHSLQLIASGNDYYIRGGI